MKRDRIQHNARQGLQKTVLRAQTWVVLAAIAATIALGWALFKGEGGGDEGSQLLPSARCGDGSTADASRINRVYQAGAAFRIRYTLEEGDCNQVPANAPQSIGGALAKARAQLLEFGLQPANEPVVVQLRLDPAEGPLQVFTDAQERGALIIDPLAGAPTRRASQGYAELALADRVPGLNARERARVGLAFALLSGGSATDVTALASSLRNTPVRGAVGLYDAWVTARYGPGPLRSALGACRTRRCDYSAEFSRALRKMDRDPASLRELFAERAVAPEDRAALRAQLRGK